MVTFAILSALALALVGTIAIPFILVGAVIWLVTLPIRLFFRLLGAVFGLVFGAIGTVLGVMFSLIGTVLGLLFGPVLLVVLVVAGAVALLTAIVSLVAPLVPLALLGLLVWAVYRMTKRPTPAF